MLFLQYLGDENRYEVNLRSISTNVLEVIGDFPHMDGGFYIHMETGTKPIDNTMYKTIYREFEDRCQFSNNGTIWYPSTKDLAINASFDNLAYAPSTIDVDVMEFYGDILVGTVTLRKDENYFHILHNVPADKNYRLVAPHIDNYNAVVNGLSIQYLIINPSKDILETMEEDLTDTQVGLAETYEQVEVNTNDILDCQLALAEIYEMIVNGGE